MKSGRYGNFPGGEVFWTPYDLNGTYLGDVVINVDQSYIIGSKKPLIVEIKHGFYKIKSGPAKILKAFAKRRKESRKLISLYEKNKSMPKSVINIYKKNFNRVGEIAINTNPKAKLSRYLIETEKIARMMHIALGSGYEPSRETTYHCDIVLNCPRQKMDIWVETPKGETIWIMRKGKHVV
jgi:leucyl aminopeptidase (aminopeptidase T)